MRLLSEGLADNVGSNGCDVLFATSEQAAVKSAQRDKPALIILIVGSPDIDALGLFKSLKTAPTTAGIPILVLTAEDSEAQEVLFLDYGADDYVGGGASLNADSLLARCRSILRRGSGPVKGRQKPVQPSAFSLNPEQNEVTIGKKVFRLAPKEFELIQHLARHEAPLTRQALFRKVWPHRSRELPKKNASFNEDVFVTQSRKSAAAKSLKTVEVHLANLRKKLGKRLIKNIRNKGYFLDPPQA